MTRRTSNSSPDLRPRFETVRLAPGRILQAGRDAKIRVPGRVTLLRAKFLYGDDQGGLTFVDPRNNGLRTVRAEAVDTICRGTSKLRDNS